MSAAENDAQSFLTGGGDMAARMAAYDWSSTLGPVASWPQSLKTIVGFMMHSPVALVLLWGEDGIMLYNDAYSKFAGRRHPKLLGSKVREGWPEVADFNDNVMKVGLGGGTLSYKAQMLSLDRRGTMEPAWLDLDYSPVIDESGKPGGVMAVVVETTEQVIAARNLAESERQLQAALSAGRGIGTWDWNVAEDRVFADERFARLYGVDPARARAGAPLAEFFANIHQDDRDRVTAQIQQALQTGERFNAIYRLNQPDGRVRWVEAEGQCARDAQGRPLHFPGVTFDVTDARQAHIRLAALAELADRIRDNIGAADLAYAAAEILGRALGVSRAGYGVIDKDRETITIERDWNAPGIKSLAGVLNFRDYGSYIEDLKRGETVVFADARIDPRTRATAAALEAISARAVLNMPVSEQGDLVALLYLNHATAREWTDEEVSFIREVAERTRTAVARRQAEAELRANEAQFESFAQAVPNHVWAGTPDGRLYWFNQQTLDYSGMAHDDLAGDGWAQIVHQDDVAAAASAWKRALISGQTYETEFRIRRADGDYRWHVVRALPIRDPEEKIIRWVGTNTDIHDQKSVADALAEETTALDLLNRSASNVAAELDLDRVVQMVVDTGVALTGAQFGAFFYNVIDARGESYMLYAISGVERSHFDKFPMPRNTAIFAPTFKGEGVMRSGDITKDPRYGKNMPHKGMPQGHLPVRSYLAVPVTSRTGEVIGGLFFGHADTDIFDARAERLMAGLAAHASIGIDNARLFQTSQRLNQTLEERVVERTGELERSEAQMRSILETTHIYQGLLDLEGRLENANATALSGIDADLESVIGQFYWDTPWFTDTPGMTEIIRKGVELAGRGQTFRQELLLKLPTGERWFDFAMRPLLDDRDEVIGLVTEAADITERRQAEDALRQAQKMEAVGQLTGGIAHDFNNLLQGITGALDRVQHRIAQGRHGDVERFLKAAIESANRAGALTHRLLAFSRRQTLDPRPIDANRLIGGMEELVRRTMGPNISVEVVGAGGLWPIRVDPSQLENSLLNLSINARDAMPDGGTLTIETANKWLDDRAARERELSAGQYVTLCVTDSGTGMTPEVIARAFDPFFTTKPLGQGTGLGLSMIYGFVRQSGGQVRVYSEIGKGTTMCLYFPRHMGKLEDEDAQGSETVERGFGETVLVVDDEPTVRMLVAEVLSESYYNILEAGDGPAALKILESDRRIDLMITDVGLPGGMNGRQVADAARVLRKNLKVLFITGYAENAAVGNGHLDPGMEILAKPFAMSTLANKVREMIER